MVLTPSLAHSAVARPALVRSGVGGRLGVLHSTSPLLLDDGPFSGRADDGLHRPLPALPAAADFKRATLYTEMVTANTLVHADPERARALPRPRRRRDAGRAAARRLGPGAAAARGGDRGAVGLRRDQPELRVPERPRGGARLLRRRADARARARRRVLRGDRRRRGPGRPGERQVPDRRRGRRRGRAAPRRRRGVREPLRLRRRRRRGQRRPPLCRPRAQGGARRALARAEPQGAAAQAGARPPPRRRARRHPVLAQRRAADGRRLRSSRCATATSRA